MARRRRNCTTTERRSAVVRAIDCRRNSGQSALSDREV
jgi:hypothetical protein